MSVANIVPRTHGLKPRPVSVRSAVHKVIVGEVSLHVLRVSPVDTIPTKLYRHSKVSALRIHVVLADGKTKAGSNSRLQSVKANSHIPCRPLPCHSAKGLDCVFPIWFKAAVFDSRMSGRAVPCHDHAFLKTTSQGHGIARHGKCELASAVQRRHVGDRPKFGFFRLTCRVPRRLLLEAYQSVKLQD
jgi:hypothetical protein